MDAVRFIFSFFLVDPMLNILVGMYSILFDNFGLSIIVFTVVVRLMTLPLQLKQTRQMKAMQALQPKMKEIQARHPKDPQRRSQETMRLYREAGVNPLGCLGPFFVQIPIWIGLYQGIIKTLGDSPDHLVGLSQRLYSWNPVGATIVPLSSQFLWMDLAEPDPSPIILPLLVAATTWAQQKMTMMPSADPRQASTNNMMLWMMPIMLGFFSLSFPSGLALYWTISNLFGVLSQGFITKDWSPLVPGFVKNKRTPVPEPSPEATPESAQQLEPKEIHDDGTTRDDRTTRVDENVRKDRRRSNRSSSERVRRKSGRGRNRNIKPR